LLQITPGGYRFMGSTESESEVFVWDRAKQSVFLRCPWPLKTPENRDPHCPSFGTHGTQGAIQPLSQYLIRHSPEQPKFPWPPDSELASRLIGRDSKGAALQSDRALGPAEPLCHISIGGFAEELKFGVSPLSAAEVQTDTPALTFSLNLFDCATKPARTLAVRTASQ
jgi:hypothetical protein